MSNTTPTPSTPKVPKPKQPADPAGQTTTILAVDPDSTPWVDDLDDDMTPKPKKKRKLPRWAWPVVGGVIAAILYWIARDFTMLVAVVAMGAITAPKARSMVRSWKQEFDRKHAAAAASAGQPAMPTNQHATSNGLMIKLIPAIASMIIGIFAAGVGAVVGWQVAGYMVASGAQWAPWATWVSVGMSALLIGAMGTFIGGIIGLVARNILRRGGLGQ